MLHQLKMSSSLWSSVQLGWSTAQREGSADVTPSWNLSAYKDRLGGTGMYNSWAVCFPFRPLLKCMYLFLQLPAILAVSSDLPLMLVT